MPRITDHETRNRDILSSAIELYLKSAQPVSSDVLRKLRKKDLSSATLRNVLSELEEMGFLAHPHTSAGRVPTDEGYRYYVNLLMKKKKLKKEEASIIDKIYELKVQEIDDLLDETSHMMSDFTHYTSFVCYVGEKEKKSCYGGMRYIFEQPEFHDMAKAHMIVEALEKKEELLELINKNFSGSTQVYIGKETNNPHMEHCSIVVSRYESKNNQSGRLALIGPKRMAYDEVIPFMEYLSEAMAMNMERF